MIKFSSSPLHFAAFAPLSLALLALQITPANASGFALDGIGSAAMGNSFSGQVTGAHNISDMFVNPAVLTQFSDREIVSDNMLLDYSIKIGDGATAQTAASQNIDLAGDGSAGLDGGDILFIPALYLSRPLSDKTYFGFGVSVPWGLNSVYSDTWIGRYQAIDSKIQSINLTPAIAHKVNDQLSVAGGVQLQYLDATLSTAIDFGTIASAGGPNLALDGKAEITGDAWALGYQLGLLYVPNNTTRFGVAYRSKVHHDLTGDAEFTVPTAVAAVTAGGAFVDTNITASITTPERLTFGWQQTLSSQVELVTEASYTRWSRLKSLTIDYANTNQPDDTTIFNWQNNWFVSTGLNYFYQKNLILRSGIGYEGSAVTQQYFGPRVPTPNKYLLSFGGSYQVSDRLFIDANYIHYFFERGYSALPINPANPFSGTLNTSYDLTLDGFAGSVRFIF